MYQFLQRWIGKDAIQISVGTLSGTIPKFSGRDWEDPRTLVRIARFGTETWSQNHLTTNHEWCSLVRHVGSLTSRSYCKELSSFLRGATQSAEARYKPYLHTSVTLVYGVEQQLRILKTPSHKVSRPRTQTRACVNMRFKLCFRWHEPT